MQEHKDIVKMKRHFLPVVLAVVAVIFFLFIWSAPLVFSLISAAWKMLGISGNMSDEDIFLLTYAIFIVMDALVLIYTWFLDRDVFQTMLHGAKGGRRGNTFKMLGLGILAGFLMNGFCVAVAWFHGDIHFYLSGFSPVYMIAAFIFVLIQCAAEELLCRGYAYGALERRYPSWVAIVVNSVYFMVLHLNNEGMGVQSAFALVITGILFSLVVWDYESLWCSIGIHTMWNYTQSLLLGLPNSGNVSKASVLHLEAATDSIFYDVSFGIEAALQTSVVIILLSAAILFRHRKRTGNLKV